MQNRRRQPKQGLADADKVPQKQGAGATKVADAEQLSQAQGASLLLVESGYVDLSEVRICDSFTADAVKPSQKRIYWAENRKFRGLDPIFILGL